MRTQENTTKMPHLTLRLPEETLKQVDQIREQLADQTGIPVTRADALRMLINTGLKHQRAGK